MYCKFNENNNENIEFCNLRGQHLFAVAMSALLVGDFRIQ